ncbi:MAG: VWA domain-containing protein [Bacteroidetes bacterium]|nr:VWA domain-containing protein [Bacteroidota bacterium]
MKKFTAIFFSCAIACLLSILFSNCSKEPNGSQNELSNGAWFDESLTGISGSYYNPADGEGYNSFEENPFVNTLDEAVSTFSIDADGASYSNIRRFLKNNQQPPKDAVRSEELMNFFPYDYPEPNGSHPISLNGEISQCPWTPQHKLLRIGIKGKYIAAEDLPPANFVFLIDVSGSMSSPDKLDLLKEAFTLYADYLRPQDKIAIVTYAGEAGVLLSSTPGDETSTIKNAIAQLGAGGSTNGAGGIIKAYDIAIANFIPGGNNRVILGTDGDFNVGISSQDELVDLIEEKRETGVFLSVLGVGTGNLQDGKMEQLADNGNGTYEYLDDLEQAKKVFVHEYGKLFTVAKDVKIQIEFNTSLVLSYRLIGYENRLLEEEDFENDAKDAGEIGAGQCITALYELVMVPAPLFNAAAVTVDFRYKLPDSDESQPLALDILDTSTFFTQSSENMRFAATSAGYGLMLRKSEYKGDLSWDDLLQWCAAAQSFDPNGWRSEFIQWIQKAKDLE